MSDDEQQDTLAALRANLDQLIALAPELARTARGFFNAYSDEGFGDSQALYLTAAQVLQNPGSAP